MKRKAKGCPREMRYPRKAGRGWYYINHGSLDVVAGPEGNGITTLKRRQLIAALRIMDAP